MQSWNTSCVQNCQKFCVEYLDVLDASSRQEGYQLILDQKRQWVIVEGDAKVYKQSLKFEHSGELNWMVPYPGDWHLLKNYQAALMKPYSDAGLSALAKASGYPLASIKSCTQFKQTHKFVLEAWEGVYRVMLTKFLATLAPDDKKGDQSITEMITPLQKWSHRPFYQCSHSLMKIFLEILNAQLAGMKTLLKKCFQQFQSFIQSQATVDNTWVCVAPVKEK